MHQTAERCCPIMDGTIDIDDMASVVKRLIRSVNSALDVVDRLPALQYICLCNKDYLGLRQAIVVLSCLQRRRIHDAPIVTSTPPCRAARRTLDLDVEFLSVGKCMNVQTNAVSVEVLNGILRYDSRRMEVWIVQDNLDDKVNTCKIVLKDNRHKRIVE